MLTQAMLLVAALAPQDVEASIAALVERSAGVASAERIGTSRGGRPIHALTVARRDGAPLADRPALLVVAGEHGRHRLGTELALYHAARLVDAAADDARAAALLADGVVYVVPAVNPDGAALGRVGNARPLDLDRDGHTDEDPPDDLDGDQLIAQMRWPDPQGRWIIDPDEPRVMREADAAKGERGVYALAGEGLDNDGDGAIDEDPAAGVALHRGFSHGFAPFDREVGGIPVGEPEARALADFVFAHRNIGMAVVYGPDDNLLGKPAAVDGKKGAPLEGILQDDLPLYEAVGALYRERTGRTGKVRDRHDGSVWSWLYCDVGVPAFATAVWRLAEPAKDSTPERARLLQCDAVGRGYVAWHPVPHPDKADVEVGGFAALDDTALLADDQREDVLRRHHDALLEVASWRPRLRFADVDLSARDGVHELRAAVVNDGRLAALSAIADKSRRFSPPQVELDLGGAALLAGELRQRTENLRGLGGRAELRWILSAPAGTTLTLTLRSDFAGRDQREVKP